MAETVLSDLQFRTLGPSKGRRLSKPPILLTGEIVLPPATMRVGLKRSAIIRTRGERAGCMGLLIISTGSLPIASSTQRKVFRRSVAGERRVSGRA